MPETENALLEDVEKRLAAEQVAYLDVMEHGGSISVLHDAQRKLMQALALMDELIGDYDNQKPLIDMLSASIARWCVSNVSDPEYKQKYAYRRLIWLL